MRKLQTTDVFNALRLIRKAGLREELKPVVEKAAKKELSLESVGIEGFLTVLETFAEKKAEQAIYEFLAGPFELTTEDVAKLEILDLLEHLKQLAEENDMQAFFTALKGLTTSRS